MSDSESIKYILGTVVRELRINKGLTQEQLAEFLGLQPHSVTKIETGRTFISSEVLAKLSNFFEVCPSFFFKKRVSFVVEENIDYINEIKELLPNFDRERLQDIYSIILALQK